MTRTPCDPPAPEGMDSRLLSEEPYLEVGAGDALGQLPEKRLHDLHEL